MLKERRKQQRKEMYYPAWIVLGDDTLQRCAVLNISDHGAKLEVTDSFMIPDNFELSFSKQGKPKRPCRIIWRASNQIGVHFEIQLTEAFLSSVVEI